MSHLQGLSLRGPSTALSEEDMESLQERVNVPRAPQQDVYVPPRDYAQPAPPSPRVVQLEAALVELYQKHRILREVVRESQGYDEEQLRAIEAQIQVRMEEEARQQQQAASIDPSMVVALVDERAEQAQETMLTALKSMLSDFKEEIKADSLNLANRLAALEEAPQQGKTRGNGNKRNKGRGNATPPRPPAQDPPPEAIEIDGEGHAVSPS